ncbi:hypothetical protein L226DRAFT_536611 [Lentinus tigrinus ALCF2SS1-7]|uniref:Mid2 domain-containing protein n=1 Tax=Lentinus tigrinus ALCF2SS1-6 TaxID=1328759 RepID=A0A5C2S1H9_9APHY|nr:hypothetical protein L227DRAFT_578144 [Lentinus tigrinus ALCF2SS1-6]RPD73107.1 hypothetical protein L226DRAFT_536611 [Lentinus tigrinus ALCF2SS1-7]
MSRPLLRHAAVPRLLLFVRPLLVLLVLLPGLARAVVNITLEDTASQIIYSPPACGLTLSSAGTESCNSSWLIVTSANASDGTLTTTSGPNNSSGGFIPQLFLSVRALALNIKTSLESNATVNISVSTSNPVVSVSARVNTSIQPISIIGLAEDRLTTLALTFDQSNVSTVLDIDSITLTVSDNNTAPFVAPSLPSSSTLATVTPSVVIPTPSSPAEHGQSSGDIAAEVLGALLGAVLLAAGAFLAILFVRKRKRRVQTAQSALPPPVAMTEQPPRRTRRPRRARTQDAAR